MKRFQRLDGEDHFGDPTRPVSEDGSSYSEQHVETEPQSALRADDIDTFLRYITYEEKVHK